MNRKKFHLISTPLFAILGRAGGVIILFVMARIYGATPETDVFFFISGIIVFLAGVFSRFFEGAIIPRILEYKKKQQGTFSLLAIALCGAYLVAGIVWVTILLALGPFIRYATGISSQYLSLSYDVFFLLSIFLFLGITLSLIESIFNSYKIFWFPASSPAIRSIIAITFMVLGHEKMGVHALSLGYVFGEGVRLLMGCVILIRMVGWKVRFKLRDLGVEIKSFVSYFSLQFMGVFAVDILPMVDQWFATWLSQGSLSLLNYGDRLMLVADQLFLIGFLQVFLAYWADHYHSDSFNNFASRVNQDLKRVTIVSALVAIAAWIVRTPIVNLSFGRGDLSTQQLETLSHLLGWLIIGFVPTVINLLYVRVLFVIKDNKVYFAYSWVQLILKCILTWLCMRAYGVQGIAMATAITYGVTTAWMHFYVQKKFTLLTARNHDN